MPACYALLMLFQLLGGALAAGPRLAMALGPVGAAVSAVSVAGAVGAGLAAKDYYDKRKEEASARDDEDKPDGKNGEKDEDDVAATGVVAQVPSGLVDSSSEKVVAISTSSDVSKMHFLSVYFRFV